MSAENSDLVWLPALGGLAVKSLLVFLIAGAALLALRRASASARHLVCLLTLAGLLALPLLSAALPGWRLVIPTPALRATPPAPTHRASAAGTTGGGGVLEGGKVGVDKGGMGKAGAASGAPTLTALTSSSSRFGRTPVSGANKEVGSLLWLFSLWLTGALLSLLRPGFGLWGIARLFQASEPVSDAPTLALAAGCAAALGLAHVRRRDWLSHRMADAVCALYWFHPSSG